MTTSGPGSKKAGSAEGAAVVGQRQQTNMSFGCFTRVEDGKADATLCID